MSPSALGAPLRAEFFARPVVEVARDLVGCGVSMGAAAGTIVETEAYHQREPACHAYVGITPRTGTLFGPPGRAYVYRSYGIHALLNAVAEPEGTGAAVLIRALEPVAGLEAMRARRGVDALLDLCSGPGKLTQALGIDLDSNGSDLARGPVVFHAPVGRRDGAPVASRRVGITRAVELAWRFTAPGSPFVSRPRPGKRGGRPAAAPAA